MAEKRAPTILLSLVQPTARPPATELVADHELPAPPAEFDSQHAETWREVVSTLSLNGTWRPGAEHLVRFYVVAHCEAVTARQDVMDRGLMILEAEGAKKVLNPSRAIACDAEATAARLAKLLGLVPGPRRGG